MASSLQVSWHRGKCLVTTLYLALESENTDLHHEPGSRCSRPSASAAHSPAQLCLPSPLLASLGFMTSLLLASCMNRRPYTCLQFVCECVCVCLGVCAVPTGELAYSCVSVCSACEGDPRRRLRPALLKLIRGCLTETEENWSNEGVTAQA